jgi:hypothetical protein
MADGGLSKMYQLVQWLSNQKDVDAFLDPVDWKALGLTDYPLVIAHPMDLGTIKGRLESGHYSKHAQVAEDVRLVWNNCKAYNQEGSYLYKIAEKLAGKFEEKYNKIKTEEPEGPEDENQPPSLEDKRQFRANMYKITSDQLGEIVQTLEQQCPEALAKVGGKDEIEINIDKIAPRTFHFLANLVKNSLPEKKVREDGGEGMENGWVGAERRGGREGREGDIKLLLSRCPSSQGFLFHAFKSLTFPLSYLPLIGTGRQEAKKSGGRSGGSSSSSSSG